MGERDCKAITITIPIPILILIPIPISTLNVCRLLQSFRSICELTSVEEGSIVRCIVRLVEACRDVRNTARIFGDANLFQLMQNTAQIIKRDIVFAASLYVN